MPKLPKEQDKLWMKCPAGAIQKVADSAMVTRGVKPAVNLQRRKLLTGTATAAGVAVLGGVAYLATSRPGQNGSPVLGSGASSIANYNFGGINCIEVVEAIPAYIAKTIEDQEKTEKIDKHLKLCDKCRMIYERQLET